MLQFDRRFNMLGYLHSLFAIGCKAGEYLGQQSKLVARKHPEQRIVNGTLKSREPRQSMDTLTGDGELDPATVARMHALLEEAVGHQLVDFVGNERAAQMQSGGYLIYPHRL